MSQKADARGLRRNFSWSLVGQVIYAGCQWGTLFLLAKVGTQEEAESRLGAFVLALAITSPIVLLANMELRVLIATDAEARHTPREYLTARAASMLAMIGATVAASLVLGEAAEIVAIVALVALARLVEGLLDLAHGFYQRDERHVLVALSQGLRGPAGLIGLAIGLFATGSMIGATAGLLAGWTVVLLFNDGWRVRALVRESAGTPASSSVASSVWAVVRRALPLGIVASLISLNTNVPRYLLDAAGGTRLVGVFGSIAYVLAVLSLMNQALRAATAPRLARHLAEGELRAVRRLTLITLLVASGPGLVVLGVAWAVGGPVLALLYRPEFAVHADILVILCLAGILGGLAGALRSLLTAGNVLVAQVPMLVSTVLITGVVAWFLIPDDLLRGAAWAVVSGRVFLVVINALLAAKLLRERSLGSQSGCE